MAKSMKAIEKKKDAVRLTPAQERIMTRLTRYFQDRPASWSAFLDKRDPSMGLGIDPDAKASSQSLWIVALDLLEREVDKGRAAKLF